MKLLVDSDEAYLALPNAKSRIAGYFYLSSIPLSTDKPTRNTPILVTCKTIHHFVSSAAESETSGVFINAEIALPMQHMLEYLGHPQPPTLIKSDKSTITGFINNNIYQKRSKSWDMRYHWLREKENQQMIKVY